MRIKIDNTIIDTDIKSISVDGHTIDLKYNKSKSDILSRIQFTIGDISRARQNCEVRGLDKETLDELTDIEANLCAILDDLKYY